MKGSWPRVPKDGTRPQWLADLALGRPVVAEAAEYEEGYLLFAADLVSVDVMALAVRYTSGFLCVALPAAICDHLRLPPMWPTNLDKDRPPYTVTVDARHGVTTGISAIDRTRTARLLADPTATEADFARPGHVMVVSTGRRYQLADIAVDVMTLAGRSPAAVFGAIVSEPEPTRMASSSELGMFAEKHEFSHVSLTALANLDQRTA